MLILLDGFSNANDRSILARLGSILMHLLQSPVGQWGAQHDHDARSGITAQVSKVAMLSRAPAKQRALRNRVACLGMLGNCGLDGVCHNSCVSMHCWCSVRVRPTVCWWLEKMTHKLTDAENEAHTTSNHELA